MQYFIDLKTKKGYKTYEDYSLPGIIPDRTFGLMEANTVDERMGLCDKCGCDRKCHVMVKIPDEETPDGYGASYKKLCPILFHDVMKPEWKVEDVL